MSILIRPDEPVRLIFNTDEHSKFGGQIKREKIFKTFIE